VIFGQEQLTYRELNQKANLLAHYLKTLGVKPDVLVGVSVERSIEMIVALLGILKAGGAYLPLDISYPADRLRFMVEDAQALVLLTQSHLVKNLPMCGTNKVCLDTDWQAIANYSTNNPNSEVTPEHLAYVIYTSGSTGKPKGVAMPHHPLVNLLTWQLQNFRISKARTLQFTPISFDVSFQEIFSTLCSGGTLVLVSDSTRRNAEALLHYLSEQAIERLFLPYIALQHLAEVAKTQITLPIYLREVITAGEQLKITDSISHWFSRLEDCTLENQYGPSESHVVTAYTLSGSPKQWSNLPPIGKPIANSDVLPAPHLRGDGVGFS
jgi:amino acid adenylation domain-containing protein